MAMTRSVTRKQNHDDDDASSPSSKKRFNTFDKGDVAQWSDVNHDVLFLVMMQLGVVDFIAFSGVCKSWRSLALSNRNMFMMSKPPMKIRIEPRDNEEGSYCCLEDNQGRISKTILPHSGGRISVGSTCGYLILFGRETRDFWLVNPITRHELHFPDCPLYVGGCEYPIRPILVFSPSISGWVFVMPNPNKKISFCIAGKRGWNHVSSTVPIIDLHVFKGKIYTLQKDCSLGELRLDPKSKLKVMEMDFGEMKWVSPGKTIEEYAIFVSYWMSCFVINPESWAGSWRQQFESHGEILDTCDGRQGVLCYEGSWYFHHHCLNVNMLDE